jgi:hypothetical protein
MAIQLTLWLQFQTILTQMPVLIDVRFPWICGHRGGDASQNASIVGVPGRGMVRGEAGKLGM